MAVMGSPHGCVFRKTSFTMFGAHCPFIPLKQLAESKVYPHFKERFLNKFIVSGNPSQGAKGLIERAEYYDKYYGNSDSNQQ